MVDGGKVVMAMKKLMMLMKLMMLKLSEEIGIWKQ